MLARAPTTIGLALEVPLNLSVYNSRRRPHRAGRRGLAGSPHSGCGVRQAVGRAPDLIEYDGGTAAEFPFMLRTPANSTQVRLTARPDVLVDGGRDTEPPAGTAVPTVLGWRSLDTDEFHRTTELTVPATALLRAMLAVAGHTAVYVPGRTVKSMAGGFAGEARPTLATRWSSPTPPGCAGTSCRLRHRPS
jgi:hypothetical protein